jgi:hypothetical protein
VNAVIGVLALVGTLVVVWKAFVACQAHGSRSMLLLAVGLLLTLVVADLFEMGASVYLEQARGPDSVPSRTTYSTVQLAQRLVRLTGVAALLGSLYVRE